MWWLPFTRERWNPKARAKAQASSKRRLAGESSAFWSSFCAFTRTSYAMRPVCPKGWGVTMAKEASGEESRREKKEKDPALQTAKGRAPRTRRGRIRKDAKTNRRRDQGARAWRTRRHDPQLRSEYLHRCHSKAKGVAKVAAARKLAIRLYWMLRTNRGYPEVVRVESSSRVALVSAS
jgi:hypothetical protein